MRILVAGATGALGQRLVPLLVANGHQVVGTTRHRTKQTLLADLGATPAVVNALDRDAVERLVGETEPEVVVHQLTAIPPAIDMRRFDKEFALTNRLRTEGTDILLAASSAVGVKRFVAQSHAIAYGRTGAAAKTEDDGIDQNLPELMKGTVDAISHLENAVSSAEDMETVILRYGWFYGPGTSISLDPVGSQVELLRRRQFPMIGNGSGIWSFVHVDDAARATLRAVEGNATGVFNVVDDEPARVSEYLPVLARIVGAKPPRRVPRWLGRLLAGEAAVMVMTELRGAVNEKAKRELEWGPRYRSWRRGFVEGLG